VIDCSKSKRTFEESIVCKIFLNILQAVKVMHTHDPPIAHRDLKLENVLLSSDRVYKLCDFGSCHGRMVLDSKLSIANANENIEKYTTIMYRAPGDH
jgi:AP2-associated kinase